MSRVSVLEAVPLTGRIAKALRERLEAQYPYAVRAVTAATSSRRQRVLLLAGEESLPRYPTDRRA